MSDHRSFTETQKKWIAGVGIFLFLLLSTLVFFFAGKPLIQFAQEPERFRAWVDEQGVLAPIAFLGMLILQIVVAAIPGEPLEIAAGYAFGALEGTLLCMFGAFIGRVAVFLLDEAAIEGTARLSITHEAIARHLGTHREVVTRMLRYFQGEGMVKLARGCVEILDEGRLAGLRDT